MAGARQQVHGAADVVFAHCLTVLGDEALAEDAARTAFLRAGPWRATLLGHARDQAVRRAEALTAQHPALVIDGDTEVTDVARALAHTRPPLERAIIDLRSRTGTDRLALGRALGLPAAAAADRATAVGDVWDSELDPALLAFLGPGDCGLLATILGGEPTGDAAGASADVPEASDRGDVNGVALAAPPASLTELLALVAPVAAHTAECEVCADRRRAMVSVRTLFGGSTDAGAPASVRMESRRSRVRRPVGLPPPIDQRPDRGRRVQAWLAIAAVVLALVGAVAVAVVNGQDSRPREDAVGELTKLATGPVSLVLVTSPIGSSATAVRISNEASHPVRWRAAPTAAWVALSPSEGRLGPGGTATAVAQVASDSPEGALTSLLTVTADDGTAVATELHWTVERAPDVQAALRGCVVKATVAEAGEVSEVTLHVRNGDEKTISMAPQGDGWEATLPPSPAPLAWWVAAVDDRGNAGRIPDQPAVATSSC